MKMKYGWSKIGRWFDGPDESHFFEWAIALPLWVYPKTIWKDFETYNFYFSRTVLYLSFYLRIRKPSFIKMKKEKENYKLGMVCFKYMFGKRHSDEKELVAKRDGTFMYGGAISG